jgi:multidrug efflux system outer membrane protein
VTARRCGKALCLCAAIALGGCTVGPDYLLPFSALFNGAPENGRFVSARNAPTLSVAPVPDNWWKLYDDPRLDALIEQAFAANTDLRVAAANL